MISFAAPWALVLLPLPFVVWRFFAPRRERVPALRFPFFRQIVTVGQVEAAAGSVILRRTRLQMAVAVLVWAMLVVALTQPARLGAPVELTKSARDVVLAIDISGSMDTVDFETASGERLQRLQAVKNVVGEFVANRSGDRVALIVFGTRAFLQAPLTADLTTIEDLLNQTEVGMAGPHTAIGDAIGLGIRTFEVSEVDQRLMILLSDGADTGSRMSPLNAAEIAASKGVEIHTVAVGDPAGAGENRVDVAALEGIAQRTGGGSFFASDVAGLADVYDRIDALTPRLVETVSYRPKTALAGWFLAVAAVLGLLAMTVLTYGRIRQGDAA
ncbi:vWA domain-containing protein [Shimia biformata]|uniref:vWA domain-containing protein n=1 Tax=Shimia biformata TaxID=1294299 RepID=UPI00194E7A8B|nr:VWA domain-containing protein [Shimia biformata]